MGNMQLARLTLSKPLSIAVNEAYCRWKSCYMLSLIIASFCQLLQSWGQYMQRFEQTA